MKQVTEYWVSPLDQYGDSIDVYYCDTRQEAAAERANRADDHPSAKCWALEKVIRRYYDDGELASETVVDLEW